MRLLISAFTKARGHRCVFLVILIHQGLFVSKSTVAAIWIWALLCLPPVVPRTVLAHRALAVKATVRLSPQGTVGPGTPEIPVLT